MGCCGVTKSRVRPCVPLLVLPIMPAAMPFSARPTAIPAVTIEPPKEQEEEAESPDDAEQQLEQLAGIFLRFMKELIIKMSY